MINKDYRKPGEYRKMPTPIKNPVIRWLMDAPPTRFEAILCVVGLVTLLVYFLVGVTE